MGLTKQRLTQEWYRFHAQPVIGDLWLIQQKLALKYGAAGESHHAQPPHSLPVNEEASAVQKKQQTHLIQQTNDYIVLIAIIKNIKVLTNKWPIQNANNQIKERKNI